MKHLLRLSLAIALLAVTGCSNKKIIRVSETNFVDEINQYQNLIFQFNHDLVPDSLLNIWDSVQYIDIKPEVKGRFKWTAPDELIFSPSEGFNPSTDYTASLTTNLCIHSKTYKRTAGEKFKFHTPYLAVESAYAYWTIDENDINQIEVHIIICFNYQINPRQLDKMLKLMIRDKAIGFRLLTQEMAKEVCISIAAPTADASEAIPVKLIIDKSLQCEGSNWTSKKDHEFRFEIPPQDQLQVTEVETAYEEGKGIINVLMTQPIISKTLKNYITISPPLDFTVEKLPNGFKIKGDFTEDQTYLLKISGKIKGAFGKIMGNDYTNYVNFGALEPYLSFIDREAVYLSSRGARNLGVNIINVPRIELKVFKVFENNILHYLRRGRDWDYYYDENDNWYDYYHYPMNENYGKVIFNKEISTDKLPKKGNLNLLNINLDDIEYSDDYKGLYIVKVESTEKKWLKDVILVSVSDIGLIVKQGTNSIRLFANSISEGIPLAGVNIRFISNNNQLAYSTITDDKGVAIVNDTEKLLKGFHISLLTARYGDDFNYLWFDNTNIETSRFDVGGKYTGSINYDVFIYGDRDIYRPGDTVYFNTIVRGLDWSTVSEIPVKSKILLPNGKEYRSFRNTLNKNGAAENSLHLPPDILTGVYTIEVYSGNDVLLNSRYFSVEEFMPDRIKVTTKTDKDTYDNKEEVKLHIKAVNLFGPPAANRNYEAEMILQRKIFTSKKYNNYIFDIQTEYKVNFDYVANEGKTDDEGKATVSFQLPEYKNIGIVKGTIYTTVFDETGRPVNRINNFDWYTQKIFLGIRDFSYWLNTRKTIAFNFLAIDRDSRLQNNINATVQVKRYHWETVIERDGDRYNYRSQKREQLVLNRKIVLNGAGNLVNFTPIQSGEYEVRIMASNGQAYVSRNFYAYGWGDTDLSSFEVDKDGEITIETDKDKYKVGDKARILFNAPFTGNLLVTVERDNVLEHFFLKMDKKAASLNLPIREDFLPNIYITATAIRKMSGTSIPLTVAHGLASVIIEKPSNKLEVNITAPESSRSKSRQTIRINTDPNTELTIAVVDEGILQVTAFETPDPYKFFYGKRALEVNSYDLYSLLFPELLSGRSSVGGGAGNGMGKRINPLTSKRVEMIAFWSGIVKTNANGEYSFTFNIPQFSGALRVMAVAYKDKKFGSGESLIKVADPVVISTALPRFLSPEDKVDMPVILTNTLDKSTTAKVSLSLTGPLLNIEEKSKSVKLQPRSEVQLMFEIKADKNIGIGNVVVDVDAFNEKFTNKTEITIRPPSGLQMRSGAGSISGGNAKTFKVTSDFISSTTETKLVLSNSPLVQFSKDITDLVRYPYGCLEQTISTAFPQIYLKEILSALDLDKKTLYFNPDYNVQQAIRKVESMQQYNGGMSYWPGSHNINWWTTVYAAHFLYEAKMAGFDVNEKILDNLYKYLNQKVKEKEKVYMYYHDVNNKYQQRLVASRETFYSLYVLALAGKQNRSVMNHYKSNLAELTSDSRYMLAATFSLVGDNKSYRDILPGIFSDEKTVREFAGSFSSYIRDKAISLYTMLEVDPSNPQIGPLAKSLSENIRDKSWLSTQERSFAFLALGKLAKMDAGKNVTAKVFVEEKEIGSMNMNTVTFKDNINNKTVKITTSGDGKLYYYYVVEGISASGDFVQEDKFLMVRKNFFDRDGNLITGNTFSQNDLIVIELSIRTTDNSEIPNVVVTDLLPACFEIENPRISPNRELKWMHDRASIDYMDIRDDRISYFVTARGKTQNLYYMVRAVSKGSYKMGPVNADAMYNGEYHSYYGARTVVVK